MHYEDDWLAPEGYIFAVYQQDAVATPIREPELQAFERETVHDETHE